MLAKTGIMQKENGSNMESGQSEGTKDIIGYLPEERGLYRRLTVMDSLLYLGALKNRQSKKRALELLERMEMLMHKDRKLSELRHAKFQSLKSDNFQLRAKGVYWRRRINI